MTIEDKLEAVHRDVLALRDELRERVTADDQLLTAEQAAAIVGRTPSALKKAAQRGSIPFVRSGRKILFRRGTLVARASQVEG